jgi:hypothetical protein
MKPKTIGIIGTIAFIITSIACYQGAMRGVPWLGMAMFALELIVLLPLMLGKQQRVLIATAIAAIGLVLDTLLIAVGIYSVETSARWILPSPICPEWILALWLNFGLVMPNYLAMMKGRHIVSGLVGFVYAFMVYGGAARNNIIALPNYGMTGVAIIAITWAILVPLMYMYVAKLFQKWTTQAEEDHAQSE